MVGGNKKERKTHHHHPLHVTRKHRMAAVGTYSPCPMKAGALHHGENKNSIEKGRCEKTSGMGGITITNKLTIDGLEWHRSRTGMAATGP